MSQTSIPSDDTASTLAALAVLLGQVSQRAVAAENERDEKARSATAWEDDADTKREKLWDAERTISAMNTTLGTLNASLTKAAGQAADWEKRAREATQDNMALIAHRDSLRTALDDARRALAKREESLERARAANKVLRAKARKAR